MWDVVVGATFCIGGILGVTALPYYFIRREDKH